MSNFKFSKLKKPLLGAALLKTATVLMGKSNERGCRSEVGKNQLGINDLILEETPGNGAIICTPKETETAPTSELASQWMPSDLIVVVDPFETSFVEIVFSIREMFPHDEDHVLLLVYSQKFMPSPEILTPKSRNQFQLDINTLEVLGIYDIPAQRLFKLPSTRIGSAVPRYCSIVSFGVNLDTSVLPTMMAKRESIYLQAALLPRSDFEAGNFEQNMILSEVDVISFVKNECPEGMQSFTESTESAETGAVVITK